MNDTRLPQELDELLWTAAESDDPAVIEEFEKRYPHLRAQLATRRAMVDVLRSSRPQTGAVPSFRHQHEERPTGLRKLLLVPATGALLAGLAFSAFVVTGYVQGGGNSESAPEASVPEEFNESGLEQPRLYRSGEDSERMRSAPLGQAPRPETNAPTDGIVTLPEQVGLLAALRAIAEAGKFPLEVMPGVEDVTVVFSGAANGTLMLPPREALRLLEEQAPIRVLDNGPEGFVILPTDRVATPAARASSPGSGPDSAPTQLPGQRND